MSNEKEKLEAWLTSRLTQELGITTEQPTETGLWLCSCDDGEWCPVIISTGRSGELIATETIGFSYQLDAYHSNLINVKWRKAKIRHELT